MRSKYSSPKKPAEQVVKDIRRVTRRHFFAEDKIRIVLEGLRDQNSMHRRGCCGPRMSFLEYICVPVKRVGNKQR